MEKDLNLLEKSTFLCYTNYSKQQSNGGFLKVKIDELIKQNKALQEALNLKENIMQIQRLSIQEQRD